MPSRKPGPEVKQKNTRQAVQTYELRPFGLLLLSALSFLHPITDSLAVFRVPLGLISVPCGFGLWVLWGRTMGFAVVGLGIAASVPILVSSEPEVLTDSTTDFNLYQKNLSFRLRDSGPLVWHILETKPHFATFQEVTTENQDVLEQVAPILPHQHYCDFASVGGVAVASVYPVVKGSQTCADRDGLAAMQVDTPYGLVWVVSIHLHWPYPFGQPDQMKRLLPVLRGFEGTVVIGGDFNMVPWSKTLSDTTAATRTVRVGHVNPTFDLEGWYPMPIDHVLVPPLPDAENGRVETLPRLGSDHKGVLAHFDLP